MIRPFKTWILFAVTLAVTVQPTFAGKRNNVSRSIGGNFSQPAVRAPVTTPRVNTGNSLGQIHPTKPRTPAVVNVTPGAPLRSTLPSKTPPTGAQNGIISRVQVPGAARDLIGNANADLIISRTIGREPIVALPGKGRLTGVPAIRRHEIARPPVHSPPVVPETPEVTGPSVLPRLEETTGYNNIGRLPITGTVLDGARAPVDEVGTAVQDRNPIDGVGTSVKDLEPIHDGVGTAVKDLEPIGHGTPSPNPTQPPADAHDGHQGSSDRGSIIDAVSGLIGAVGSASGSSPSSGGGDAGFAPPADSGFSGSGAAEPQPVAAVEPAARTIAETVAENKELDIELTDVRLVDAGSLEQKTGPRLRLTYRNKGAVEFPKFHVTVAVDAGPTLTETAEIVTVEAVGLKPGKSQTVDVRLPVEVLKMATDKSGKAAPFGILAAVLDSDESLDETNEENNVMILAREEIKPIEKSSVAKK